MESLGKYLRVERESRNLSLKEISELTRIKERLLKAIEEDQYELLSSPVYVKGFLDAYAKCLDLDPNDIIHRYQEYHEDKMLPQEAGVKQPSLAPAGKRKWITFRKKKSNRWFFIVSTSLVILFIGIFAYYLLSKPM